jgi:uncharacterized membrane protein YfcA
LVPLLSPAATGDLAPDWLLGFCCGARGLVGGYPGARLQPHLPDTPLRLLLGTLATGIGIGIGIGTLCAIQIVRFPHMAQP